MEKKIIEVDNFDFERTKELMLENGFNNPTDKEVVRMLWDIEDRMESIYGLSFKKAFYEIISW